MANRDSRVKRDCYEQEDRHWTLLLPPISSGSQLAESDCAEEDTDYGDMEAGEEGEAVEEAGDDPHVGAEEREEDTGLVTAEPELLGLLAVAEEGVEEGGGEQPQLVAEQLEESGGQVCPGALVGLEEGMACGGLAPDYLQKNSTTSYNLKSISKYFS